MKQNTVRLFEDLKVSWPLFCTQHWLYFKYLITWTNKWKNEGKTKYTAKTEHGKLSDEFEQVANLNFTSILTHLISSNYFFPHVGIFTPNSTRCLLTPQCNSVTVQVLVCEACSLRKYLFLPCTSYWDQGWERWFGYELILRTQKDGKLIYYSTQLSF